MEYYGDLYIIGVAAELEGLTEEEAEELGANFIQELCNADPVMAAANVLCGYTDSAREGVRPFRLQDGEFDYESLGTAAYWSEIDLNELRGISATVATLLGDSVSDSKREARRGWRDTKEDDQLSDFYITE